MSLRERLVEDMKAAMKEKDAGKQKLSVIRMVRASIKNVEIDRRHELSEEETIEVLAREVKQRRDAIEEFKKANREDIVNQLEAEIAILLEYLPAQMTEEEIREVVKAAVQETGAKEAKEMGKVMAALMPKVKGKADGKIVNQIVKEFLS